MKGIKQCIERTKRITQQNVELEVEVEVAKFFIDTSKRDGRKINPKNAENGEKHLPWRKGAEGMITVSPNNSKRIK